VEKAMSGLPLMSKPSSRRFIEVKEFIACAKVHRVHKIHRVS
jgi:hypothetical protein